MTRRAGRAQAGWSSGERQTCQRLRRGRGGGRRRRRASSASRGREGLGRVDVEFVRRSGRGRGGRRCGRVNDEPPGSVPHGGHGTPRRVHVRVQKRCGAWGFVAFGTVRPVVAGAIGPRPTRPPLSIPLLQVRSTLMPDQLDVDIDRRRRSGQRPPTGPFAVSVLLQRRPDGLAGVLHHCVRRPGDRGWLRRDQYERSPDGAGDRGRCGGSSWARWSWGSWRTTSAGASGLARPPELGGDARPPYLSQTVAVGSTGNKPRKPKRRLAKVPKYEEPNTFPGGGLSGEQQQRVRVALRTQRRPSSQQWAGSVRFLVSAGTGAEAKALRKFFRISSLSKVSSKVSGKAVPARCAVPSTEEHDESEEPHGQYDDDHRQPDPGARDPLHQGGPGDGPARAWRSTGAGRTARRRNGRSRHRSSMSSAGVTWPRTWPSP